MMMATPPNRSRAAATSHGPRDRLAAAARVSVRSAVAALALLAGQGLAACSSPSPAPPQQPVAVETSLTTRDYPVHGTTTAAIFAAIDANGLVESGQRAVGVTSAQWKLTSGDVNARAVPCVFPSLTVRLDLVVMLPRHETPEVLPAELRGRWERFAARIAAHEQRHVDIYLEGAKAMKERLEATRTAVTCANLEKAIDGEWRAPQAAFHAGDETTARSERESLQARLDDTRARLEPVEADIRRLDAELADLRRQVDAGRADLVAQHNALAGRRGTLAEEHNRLVADANGLIDALNWARW